MIAAEKKVQIYNRDNIPCNYCIHCKIDDNYTYVCKVRKFKAINALNPDYEGKVITDKQVSECKRYSCEVKFS